MLRVNQLIAIFWIASSWSMLIGQPESASWQGRVLDAGGKPVSNAGIRLENAQRNWAATTDSNGNFHFTSLAPGSYSVSVLQGERVARLQAKIGIPAGAHLETLLELTASCGTESLTATEIQGTSATGGEHLSSRSVAGLPLNKRDFSQLLLLASGTQTDTNGAANFTQQFAVNGQRGTTAVFAMDGINTTDPELGGTTSPTSMLTPFRNFARTPE